MTEADDTGPETFRALSVKFANMAAELLEEKRLTNLHLQTIASQIALRTAPRSYPYLVAAVTILSAWRIADLFRHITP
jgi:hypothetical protein